MIIKITANDTLNPNNSTIEINGNKYKHFKSLKLIIAKNSNGELVIEHESGYIEAYKGSDKDSEENYE